MSQAIKKIVTHLEPHLDELVAAYLARRFGQDVWPGINDATFSTKDGSVKIINRFDWLVIGIGEGPFDEHGLGKDTELCSADLIARHLGIEKHPKVLLLLKKIRTGDRKGKYTPLDLGQCVRMLTHIGWKPAKIEKWLKLFLDCYFDEKTFIKNNNHTTPDNSIEFPINDVSYRNMLRSEYLSCWFEEVKGIKNFNQLSGQLCKNLAVLDKQLPSKLFDLLECSSLITAHNPGNKLIAYEWVKEIFSACATYQHDFLTACEIVRKSSPKIINPRQNCAPQEIIQVLGIDRRKNNLGNRCLVSAAKFLYKNLDVLVIQQPSGNVQILILRNHRYHLLPMITRAIRLEEMIDSDLIDDDAILTYDHLAAPGRLDSSDRWYLPVNDAGVGWALLNGSLTIPQIHPTSIFFDRIMNIIYSIVLVNDTEDDWGRYLSKRISEVNINRSRQKAESTNRLGDIVR